MVINKYIIYLVGAINVSNEKDENDNPIFVYDAGIVLYNTGGKYLGKYSLEDKVYHRFNSVILENNNLILTGLLNINGMKKNEKQDSMVMKFSCEDNKFFDKKIYQEKNDFIINKMVQLNKKLIIGTSKTNCSIYGCEYEPVIEIYE